MKSIVAIAVLALIVTAGCGTQSAEEQAAEEAPLTVPATITERTDDPDLNAFLADFYALRRAEDIRETGLSRDAILVTLHRAEDLGDEDGAALIRAEVPDLIDKAIAELEDYVRLLPSLELHTEPGKDLASIYKEVAEIQLPALRAFRSGLTEDTRTWGATHRFIVANNEAASRAGQLLGDLLGALPSSYRAEFDKLAEEFGGSR